MLHHRTTDPAQRAAHIAERESKEIYAQKYKEWVNDPEWDLDIGPSRSFPVDSFRVWLDCYDEVIKELNHEID